MFSDRVFPTARVVLLQPPSPRLLPSLTPPLGRVFLLQLPKSCSTSRPTLPPGSSSYSFLRPATAVPAETCGTCRGIPCFQPLPLEVYPRSCFLLSCCAWRGRLCLLGSAVPAVSNAFLAAVPAVPAKNCCAAKDSALPPGSWSCSLQCQVLCQGCPHRQGHPPAASLAMFAARVVLLQLPMSCSTSGPSLLPAPTARGLPEVLLLASCCTWRGRLCLLGPAVPAASRALLAAVPAAPAKTCCAAEDSALRQGRGPAASHAQFSAKVFPTVRVVLPQLSTSCDCCTWRGLLDPPYLLPKCCPKAASLVLLPAVPDETCWTCWTYSLPRNVRCNGRTHRQGRPPAASKS